MQSLGVNWFPATSGEVFASMDRPSPLANISPPGEPLYVPDRNPAQGRECATRTLAEAGAGGPQPHPPGGVAARTDPLARRPARLGDGRRRDLSRAARAFSGAASHLRSSPLSDLCPPHPGGRGALGSGAPGAVG